MVRHGNLRKPIGQIGQQRTRMTENGHIRVPTMAEMLAAGEHPVNQVISDLKAMKNQGIYTLISSFIPAPLIDKAKSLQIDHWVVKEKKFLMNNEN